MNKTFKKIIEKLEELKAIKDGGIPIIHGKAELELHDKAIRTKAIEKIIEKLEEEKMSYFLTIANAGDEKLDCAYEHTADALDKAIEIVKQEAERS